MKPDSTMPKHNHLDLRAPTILIIDDDPTNLAIVTKYLEEGNFRILVAEDGESGLRRASYASPDLILLDVVMPGIDGYETCRRLKANESTRDIPVIFMTALAETEHKLRAFEAGAVDYITRPLQRADVLARAGVHLRIRELTNRLQAANELLEARVDERTEQLARANKELQEEIAERMQAEKAVMESEAKYRAIFENSGTSLIFIEEDTTISLVNREFEKLSGYCAAEVEGKKSWAELVAREEDIEQMRRYHHLRRIQPEIVPQIYEFQFRDREGRVKNAVASVVVIPGTKQSLASILDITERTKIEAQLRQAQKLEAIGTLAGGIAHDFNNLMTVVIGYSDLALERVPNNDPLHRDIEQIRKAGSSAASLTGRLLAFSRKQVLQPKVLDLNYVVADTEKMLRRLIGEDIDLVTVRDPALGRVLADPALMEQVIMNLAVNARDAMPQGGKLTIETANVHLDEAYARRHVDVQPGRYVMLAVCDTGTGMDEPTLSHVFEPFFTTKEKGKGTGLGLATVYGIVKQSGGHIWVYSELGRGTTFKVYLPPAEEDVDPVETDGCPGEVLLRGGSETILLVEDDEMVRSLARKSLIMYGYTVIEARHGAEALELFKEHEGPIQLLITDVVMPEMSGPELVRRIEPMRPGMRVLYISGYTDNAIVHHGVLNPGTAFLQKPFTPHALAGKVREILDEATGA